MGCGAMERAHEHGSRLFFPGISTIQEKKIKHSGSTNCGKLLLIENEIIFTCYRRESMNIYEENNKIINDQSGEGHSSRINWSFLKIIEVFKK